MKVANDYWRWEQSRSVWLLTVQKSNYLIRVCENGGRKCGRQGVCCYQNACVGWRVRGRPRLGFMYGVKVALDSRGKTVEAARQRKMGRRGEPWCICRWLSFTRPILLGSVFLLTAFQRYCGLSHGEGWDTVTMVTRCGCGELWKVRNCWKSRRWGLVCGLVSEYWIIVYV